MGSLLRQLENRQAVLLMYLADELPAEDRAEVVAALTGDAAMRAELEELQTVQEQVFTALLSLDRAIPAPASQAMALRQVSRAMTRWQLEHPAATIAAPTARRSMRIAAWSYPLTAAAAVIISFFIWSKYSSNTTPPVSHQSPIVVSTPDPVTLIPERDPAVQTVLLSQATRDTGDLFGNDWGPQQ